jgi:predicted metallo-beta-lactamase superfamily hydrolase
MTSLEFVPLASDSMGVRSLACYVKTPDLKMIIDPGCALGPFGTLRIPHPEEIKTNQRLTKKILEFAKAAEYLFISHYHGDHYKPPETDYFYLHTDPTITTELYGNKIIYHKQLRSLGFHQEKRADLLFKYLKKTAKEIRPVPNSNGNTIQIGGTRIIFPPEYYHGLPSTKLGFIQPLIVATDSQELYYWPDVHGFTFGADRLKLAHYLSEQATKTDIHRILVLGGPPKAFFRPPLDYQSLSRQFLDIFNFFNEIYLDHHTFREKAALDPWMKILDIILKVRDVDELPFPKVYSYHQKNIPDPVLELNCATREAVRDQLFKDSPPDAAFMKWGEACLKGKTDIPPPI